MKVKDIKTSIKKTTPDTTIPEAAKIMSEKKIGSLLIHDNGDLIGIITERDILRKVIADGMNINTTKVKDIMSAPLIKVDEDTSIESANDIMIQNEIKRLITTKDDKVTGIITLTDLSRNLKYLITKKILRK